MAWRAIASGLALGVTLVLPWATASPTTAMDEVLILSRYRSYYGANNLPRRSPHAGVDFGGKLGEPVLAAADGTVRRLINSPSGCGHGLVIEHTGFKRWTAYCHMEDVTVRRGEEVSRGQQIGLLGNSGTAMNIPHVHLELCTFACASHVDGDLAGTEDPLDIADGCYTPGKAYATKHLVLTFPVACVYWVRWR